METVHLTLQIPKQADLDLLLVLAKRLGMKPVITTHPVPKKANTDTTKSKGEIMAEALNGLAQLGTMSRIKDPVAWQREVREDKVLCKRTD